MKLENPPDFSIEEIGNFFISYFLFINVLSEDPFKLVREQDKKQPNKKQNKNQKKN